MRGLSTYKQLIRSVNEVTAVLEYDRSTTVRMFGDKIQQRLDATRDFSDPVSMLIDFEEVDPTPDHQYVVFLTKLYANGETGHNIMHDAEVLLKHHFLLKRKNRLNPDHKDIMRFKTLGELNAALQEYPSIDLLQDESNQKSAERGNAETVFDDDTVRVIQLKDETAARYYGRNTKWCTAADNSQNMFNAYNQKGTMYVLLPKKSQHVGEKYQYQPATKTLMDEKDKPYDEDFIEERFPSLGATRDELFHSVDKTVGSLSKKEYQVYMTVVTISVQTFLDGYNQMPGWGNAGDKYQKANTEFYRFFTYDKFIELINRGVIPATLHVNDFKRVIYAALKYYSTLGNFEFLLNGFQVFYDIRFERMPDGSVNVIRNNKIPGQ